MSVVSPLVFWFAIMVFAVERGALSRLLSLAPFLWVGALSYTVYMVHNFVQQRVYTVVDQIEQAVGTRFHFNVWTDDRVLVTWFGDRWAGDAVVMVMLGSVLLSAWIIHRWAEVPLRNAINRFRYSRTARGATLG